MIWLQFSLAKSVDANVNKVHEYSQTAALLLQTSLDLFICAPDHL